MAVEVIFRRFNWIKVAQDNVQESLSKSMYKVYDGRAINRFDVGCRLGWRY